MSLLGPYLSIATLAEGCLIDHVASEGFYGPDKLPPPGSFSVDFETAQSPLAQ